MIEKVAGEGDETPGEKIQLTNEPGWM